MREETKSTTKVTIPTFNFPTLPRLNFRQSWNPYFNKFKKGVHIYTYKSTYLPGLGIKFLFVAIKTFYIDNN